MTVQASQACCLALRSSGHLATPSCRLAPDPLVRVGTSVRGLKTVNVLQSLLLLGALLASGACATAPGSSGTSRRATGSGVEASHQPADPASEAQPRMVESPTCSPPLSVSEPVHGHCKPVRLEFEVQTDAEGTPVAVKFLSAKPASPHTERLGTFFAECYMAARFESATRPRTFQFGINLEDPYGPRCAH